MQSSERMVDFQSQKNPKPSSAMRTLRTRWMQRVRKVRSAELGFFCVCMNLSCLYVLTPSATNVYQCIHHNVNHFSTQTIFT